MIGIITLAIAASSTMFDLNCSGTVTTQTAFEEKTEPYNYVYVLDLESKKWCYYDCGLKKDILAVTDRGFILENEQIDTLHEYRFNSNMINRIDGSHTILSSDRSSGILMKWVGHCTKQPFTGFSSKSPPDKAKF